MPLRTKSNDPRHLLGITWEPSRRRPPNLDQWPYTIPAIAQIISDGGLDIPAGVTFLLGENGSGKSTLVEAIASAYELRHRAGHLTPFAHVSGPSSSREDSPLSAHIRCEVNRHASPAGFFLRAEMMHAFLAEVDANENERMSWGNESMQQRSHGESFLAVLRHRFDEVGVYFLDEPEAALSFRSSLGLLSLLNTMAQEGSQVVVATHSPLLVSLPGATLLQLDDEGIRRVESYEELDIVRDWRSFLSNPARYLKHLVRSE